MLKSQKWVPFLTSFWGFLAEFSTFWNTLVSDSGQLWAFKNMLNGHENIWNFKYLVFLAFWVIFSAGGKGIWAYYLRYQISPKMPNGHENAWFLAKMQTQCPFKCLNQLALSNFVLVLGVLEWIHLPIVGIWRNLVCNSGSLMVWNTSNIKALGWF